MRRAPGVLAAAVGLALAGCGSSSDSTEPATTVDTAAVERGIEQQLSTSANAVTAVKCPGDVDAQSDASFKCSVTWENGATGDVKVARSSPGTYTYEPVPGSVEVPGSEVEKSLEAQLAKEGAPEASVTCPANVIVKVGTTVTCDVTSASGAAGGSVTFTFSDAEGTVDPASVQTTG